MGQWGGTCVRVRVRRGGGRRGHRRPASPDQPVLRGAFLLVHEWNLTDKLKKRASVVKSVTHCLKGPFRTLSRYALEEASSDDVVRQDRGWKLFLFDPTDVVAPASTGVG